MSIISDLSTIRDFIRYATSRFNQAGLYYGHGTDNAWDEAVALTLHSLFLPPQINNTVLDAHLTRAEKVKLEKLIELRVQKHIPVPYLTHEAWFSTLSFYVDERVLIPRSPIAELIEQRFQPWIEPDEVQHILDLCTGSGCIAIACAKYFPGVAVDASDISEDALAVAKINVLRHHLEEQVHLLPSDLFASIPKKKYDLIISNPPYVSQAELTSLPKEYHHEPRLGLAAGPEGLDIVMRILRDVYEYLHPEHGILIVEVGNSEEALIERFPQVPFTWLEFERGGGGVFMLRAAEIAEYYREFK